MAADSAVGYPFESAEGGTWWVHAARQVGLPSERAEYFPLLGLTLLILLRRTGLVPFPACSRLDWQTSDDCHSLAGPLTRLARACEPPTTTAHSRTVPADPRP